MLDWLQQLNSRARNYPHGGPGGRAFALVAAGRCFRVPRRSPAYAAPAKKSCHLPSVLPTECVFSNNVVPLAPFPSDALWAHSTSASVITFRDCPFTTRLAEGGCPDAYTSSDEGCLLLISGVPEPYPKLPNQAENAGSARFGM